MRTIFAFSLFSLLFQSYSLAQLERARAVTEKLCSPEFHGRGYVNSGDSIAAEYISGQFKEAGCRFFTDQPFQSFNFNVNTFPSRMEVKINGNLLEPGVHYVVDPSCPSGKVVQRTIRILPVSALFDDKELLLHIDSARKFRNPETDMPEGQVLLINSSGMKGDSLKKANKLAMELTTIMPVIQVTNTKFTWSVSDEQLKHPLIQVQDIAAFLSDSYHVIDYDIEAVLRPHTARNVIAYVPAKKKSKKFIVYTAHYDHLGRMGQHAYFPGANDNASGTAMLLELAHHFSEHPLKKTNVVFMSFAGEEAGLIGSKYFVEHPLFPLQQIRFLTNVDIMGSGEEGVTVVNATEFPKQFQQLQDINAQKNYLVKIASRGKAANSDHYFFTEAGVPAFFIYTMGPNKHYHDVYDTYAELSFSEFMDIYNLLLDFAEGMK